MPLKEERAVIWITSRQQDRTIELITLETKMPPAQSHILVYILDLLFTQFERCKG